MPARLDKSEDTVRIDLKLPRSLKAKAVEMASHDDGDLASWLRGLIRREWQGWSEWRRMQKPTSAKAARKRRLR
jgi:hypothetical protein